ncbi:MAG: ABC transporter substrate-binding protein [Bacteroidetes bacterium]|nr:ABC transporter substrate-binding protein [Bacteroidota bacterium]
MKNKILQAIILLFLIVLAVPSCRQPEKKTKSNESPEIPVYRIGVNLSLTGNGSYFAEEFKKGLDLTFKYLNSQPEKFNIEVIYEDNKLNPKDAVSITKKFIEIDEVDLIISGYTPIIQASASLVNDYEVPMLVTLSSAENIAAPYDWVFRDFEIESEIMPLIAAYAYSGLALRKGSWLVVNDDMGHDVVKYFSEKFTELGGEMKEGEVFESSEMDMRNKINKVMDDNPEFIIVAGRGSAMINACRQIRERDMDIPIMGNNTLDNASVWDALGIAGNNFWFPRPYTEQESPRYIKTNEMFRSMHGYDLNWLNIYGISIANYLSRGLKESGGDREKMKEYLKTLNFKSIRGELIMDDMHNVKVPHMICQRKDGISVPVFVPDH